MFIFGNKHLKLWYIVDLITFLLFVSEFIINIQLKYLSQEEIFTSQEATINNELKPILNLSLPDSSTGNCNEGSKLIFWKGRVSSPYHWVMTPNYPNASTAI